MQVRTAGVVLALHAHYFQIARIAGMTSIVDRGDTLSALSFRKVLNARSVRGQELRNRLRRAQRITSRLDLERRAAEALPWLALTYFGMEVDLLSHSLSLVIPKAPARAF